MAFRDVTRESVLQAISEFDNLGRQRFLERYGFGPARDYVVVYDGNEYDSKALVGAAHGYAFPDMGPLPHKQFGGGRDTVVPVLRALGFQVVRRAVSTGGADPRVWLIRAGRTGTYEALALEQGVALIGWAELEELREGLSRDELKEMIRDTYNEARPRSLASQAGQIYRFIHDVEIGDLVVLPLMTNRGHVAIGRIVGDYRYRTDGPFEGSDASNTRDVEWLASAVPYERFDPDLREAYGQQGTVSEIDEPEAAVRLLAVIEGADASAIHLVLKWSPSIRPDTIDRHKEVADAQGAVWWGRQGRPGSTGLANTWLARFQQQLDQGSVTYVFLQSAAATWRAHMVALALDEAAVESDLVPTYYDPDSHHSLWVKLAEFEQVESSEITDNYVLAQSGDPVTAGGLGNQTPLIIRTKSSSAASRYFILNQGANGAGGYDDEEGRRYHWTSRSSGAWKQLANSPSARFVYYRPGTASDGTAKTYFGAGTVSVVRTEQRDSVDHFIGEITDYQPFDSPVPWSEGPARNAQTSIQPITKNEFEKLLRRGLEPDVVSEFTADALRGQAEARGLTLPDELYAQIVATLDSGKHIILTGPPGTAKTTLAQAVAAAAKDAGRTGGYVLTTATADWTTFETIGGLRPTASGELEFEEGHFLKAIRDDYWLVIDELNRSNFDRAFGQLFTVLSGQAVVLPYHRPGMDSDRPLVLVPDGAESPLPDGDILSIPQTWRVLATMNVFDKTLLFEMSFALMRRFAFIEVGSPTPAVFEALIEREAAGDASSAAIAKRMLPLRGLKDLGPAVFMDIARFVRSRLSMSPDVAAEQVLYESFYGFLLPQFEGIDEEGGEALFKSVAQLVGSRRREVLRKTLNEVLGLQLQAPTVEVSEDEEPELELIEQPE